MRSVNVYDAKTHLSSLLEQVAAGEEVVIAKNGVPMAKLVPLPRTTAPRRPAGALGVSWIAEDFDAPDPDTEVLFGGETR
jgi:prevent-host-death family protein